MCIRDSIEGIDDNIVGVAADGEIVFEAPLPQGFGDRAGNEVTFRVKSMRSRSGFFLSSMMSGLMRTLSSKPSTSSRPN